MDVREPTTEQCIAKEKVYEDGHFVGHAIWYPQMGGYVAKAVALIDKRSGCFDVLVWHDGEFPFGDSQWPTRLHHCDAGQFIEFGRAVADLIKKVAQ